jgi:putative membrane protein
MATVRTSLSLISFGFTIYQMLGQASALFPRASVSARNLGLALLVLGLATLTVGLVSHVMFRRELTRIRQNPEDPYLSSRAVRHEMSAVYLSAGSLLVIGLIALATIVFRLLS